MKTFNEKTASIIAKAGKASAVFFTNKACVMTKSQPKENSKIKNLRKF